MKTWLTSRIARKITAAILLASLLPMLLLGWLALRGFVRGGQAASTESTAALDAKSARELEQRARETAQAVADFLAERERDLRALALYDPKASAYAAFSDLHQRELWYVKEGQDVVERLPLYRELAYVDADGNEVVKVRDGEILPPESRLTIDPPPEPGSELTAYFPATEALPSGEVYVSHVVGDYVDRAAFQAGRRFGGAVRFALPRYDAGGERVGVVTLLLDARFLQAFTDHQVPTEDRLLVEGDAASGNYAYIIDDRGYVIAHPNDALIVGLGPTGERVPYARSTDELGMRPVRLDQLGFVEPALVDINAAALDGSAGSRRYVWDGTDKFVAYAPIPYTGGAYDLPAGFGWVGIGANVKRFHAAAADVERAITSQTRQLEIQTLLMIAATALLVSGGALVLAHTLTHPLLTLTDAARALEAEELDETCLAQLRAAPGSDEVAHLSHVFATMAEQVRARTRRLRREVEHLRIRIDEEKREQQVSQITETDYFQDLQEKARRMRRE